MKRTITAVLGIAMLLAACSDSGASGDTTAAPTSAPETTAVPETTQPAPAEADPATLAAVQAAVDGAPAGCDPLDTARCLLPFPSNVFTVADTATTTGLRVSLPAEGMPTNTDGKVVDPTEWNRNDGFSPNTPLLTLVPGLDAEQSNLPTWTDIGASLADDSPVVLVDLSTSERVPLWAELDSHPEAGSDRLLTIRPAISLPEGHSFAVGLRGMKDSTGADIAPTDVFRVYRDNLTTTIDSIEARRAAMEETFTALAAGGAPRERSAVGVELHRGQHRRTSAAAC